MTKMKPAKKMKKVKKVTTPKWKCGDCGRSVFSREAPAYGTTCPVKNGYKRNGVHNWTPDVPPVLAEAQADHEACMAKITFEENSFEISPKQRKAIEAMAEVLYAALRPIRPAAARGNLVGAAMSAVEAGVGRKEFLLGCAVEYDTFASRVPKKPTRQAGAAQGTLREIWWKCTNCGRSVHNHSRKAPPANRSVCSWKDSSGNSGKHIYRRDRDASGKPRVSGTRARATKAAKKLAKAKRSK